MAIEAELAVAKARIVELENEISYLGEIGDTCTYPMLQKVCNGCKCHRAAMGKE